MWGWIIAIAAVGFIIGMAMSVLPTAHQKALERLRAQAAAKGFKVRLVACPEWMIGPKNKKGVGMVPRYELRSDVDLPTIRANVLDGKLSVIDGPNDLHDEPAGFDFYEAFRMYGLHAQGEHIAAYLSEPVYAKDPAEAQKQNANFLNELERNMAKWRDQSIR